MKVVHAYNKREQGIDGDLEKSRQQLVDEFGFVSRRNYESDSDFEAARQKLREQATYKDKEQVEVNTSRDKDKDGWKRATIVEVHLSKKPVEYDVTLDDADRSEPTHVTAEQIRKLPPSHWAVRRAPRSTAHSTPRPNTSNSSASPG